MYTVLSYRILCDAIPRFKSFGLGRGGWIVFLQNELGEVVGSV